MHLDHIHEAMFTFKLVQKRLAVFTFLCKLLSIKRLPS